MKRILRRTVELACAKVGRHKWRFPTARLVILTYHRILPRNHPDLNICQPGMVVNSDTFHLHLKLLKQHFHIIELGDWLRRLDEGRSNPSRACAITFDDGWHDNFEFAFPVLKREQVPATLFLVSDYVGTEHSFWPERLARLIWNEGRTFPSEVLGEIRSILGWDVTAPLAQAVPTRNTIDEVIENAKHGTDDEMMERIRAVERKLGREQPTEAREILTWQQVREMSRSGLIAVGSHSRCHRRLSAGIPHEVLDDEIVASKQAIEAKTGTTVTVFCYPGGVTSPHAENLVRQHYQAACTTNRGWNSSRTDRFRLKRISMHEDVTNNKTSLLARVSGWL